MYCGQPVTVVGGGTTRNLVLPVLLLPMYLCGYAILPLFAILAWIHSCCNRGGAMRARFRSILVVAIILVVVIALIIVEIRVYGTGFAGKTLWDWLQLISALAIPIVVG